MKLLKILSLTSCIFLLTSNFVFADTIPNISELENQKIEITEKIEKTKDAMNNAHEIATTAREMGLSEEDAIIVRAKELWNEHNSTHNELNTQLNTINENIEKASKYEYVGVFHLTGYCNCSKCGGHSSGKTASGTYPVDGRTVAASKRFPFGTRLYIEGLGEYVVEDRGVSGNVIDMFSSTHAGCYRTEYNQDAKVYIIKD